MKRVLFLSFLSLCSFVTTSTAEDTRSEWVLPQKSYDKRLPPVIPGEEVEDMHKKTSKVWSTSGPVPVHEAPQAPRAAQGANGVGNIGVVVDGRDLVPQRGTKDATTKDGVSNR